MQIRDEIRQMTKNEREDLLKEASLPIEIPTHHALAIKADLAISWNKLRIIRRYIHIHVHIHNICKNNYADTDAIIIMYG